METRPKIRIAIVEDDKGKLNELRDLIQKEADDMECVGMYRNPQEALVFLKNKMVDIVIVDLDLKSSKDGVDVIQELKPHYDQWLLEGKIARQVKFLVNTISENRDTVFKALKAGATGYILKGDRHFQIVEAIRAIDKNQSPMSSQIARYLLEILFQPEPSDSELSFANLTEREREVLGLVAQGWSNKMISDKLGITIGVVKLHCNHIYHKLQVRNRTEAATAYQLANKNNAAEVALVPENDFQMGPGNIIQRLLQTGRAFFARVLAWMFPKISPKAS